VSVLLGWREHAACARPGIDPDLFFPEPGQRGKVARAKRICARCPVQAPCLADALTTRDGYGIRAGTTAREREQLRARARRRGGAAA
jgi:WhiB family transcriptional regulator, redox-sensing transcriptional regulator